VDKVGEVEELEQQSSSRLYRLDNQEVRVLVLDVSGGWRVGQI
jgi:hypothetical protein